MYCRPDYYAKGRDDFPPELVAGSNDYGMRLLSLGKRVGMTKFIHGPNGPVTTSQTRKLLTATNFRLLTLLGRDALELLRHHTWRRALDHFCGARYGKRRSWEAENLLATSGGLAAGQLTRAVPSRALAGQGEVVAQVAHAVIEQLPERAKAPGSANRWGLLCRRVGAREP